MMIFTSIYSVVDGFFVSNFAGKTPFAAVNLIYPFLMILSTVGLMFGTGGSAIVALTFGMGDNKRANQYFSLFVYVVAGLGVFFAILGIVLVRPIAVLLGAEGDMLKNNSILRIGYHDGAKNHSELKGLLKKSLLIIGCFGIAMVASAELLATPLAKIFVGYDAELMNITVSGFRIFALSFLFMGFAIYGSGFFTALNDGVTSAIISFLRTLVFQTAAVILLPKFLGIDGVWISIVVAEVMAVVFSAIFLITKRKKYHY